LNNVGSAKPEVSAWPARGWAAIDEVLHTLYDFCQTNDVPVKAHANNSLGAQACSSTNADPTNWQPVLAAYPKLRLNLAHFGGFEETLAPPPQCTGGRVDWEETLAGMLTEENNLFIDMGFWDEVNDPYKGPRIQAKLEALIARFPLLRDRLMYGSDWSMLARVPGHNFYQNYVHDALTSFKLAETENAQAQTVAAIERGNALRYLGLRDDTPRRRQLAAFFAGNPVFQQVVAPLEAE